MDKALVKFVGAGLSTVVIGLGRKVPVGAIANGQYLVAHLLETNPNETRQIIEGVVREIFVDWKRSGLPIAIADAHLDGLPAVLDQHRIAQNILVGSLAVAKKSSREGRRAVTVPARRIAAEFVTQARESQSLARVKLADGVTFFLVERMFAHLLVERQTLVSLTNALNIYFMKSMWMGPAQDPFSSVRHENAASTFNPQVPSTELPATSPSEPAELQFHGAATSGLQREPITFGFTKPDLEPSFKPIVLPVQERRLSDVLPSELQPVVATSVVAAKPASPSPADELAMAFEAVQLPPILMHSSVTSAEAPIAQGPAPEAPPSPPQPEALPMEVLDGVDPQSMAVAAIPAVAAETVPAVPEAETVGSAPAFDEAAPTQSADTAQTTDPSSEAAHAVEARQAMSVRRRVRKTVIVPAPIVITGPGMSLASTLEERSSHPPAAVVEAVAVGTGADGGDQPTDAPVDPFPMPALSEIELFDEPAASPTIATAATLAAMAPAANLPDTSEIAGTDPKSAEPTDAAKAADAPARPVDEAPVDTAMTWVEPAVGAVLQEALPLRTGAADLPAATRAPSEPSPASAADVPTPLPTLDDLEAAAAGVSPEPALEPAAIDLTQVAANSAAPGSTPPAANAASADHIAPVQNNVDEFAKSLRSTLPSVDVVDFGAPEPADSAPSYVVADTRGAGDVSSEAFADAATAATDRQSSFEPGPDEPRTPNAALRVDAPSSQVMNVVRTSGGEVPITLALAVEHELAAHEKPSTDVLKAACLSVLDILQRLTLRSSEADHGAAGCAIAITAIREGRFGDARDTLRRLETVSLEDAQHGGDMASKARRAALEVRLMRADFELACADLETAAAHLAAAVEAVPENEPARRFQLALRRARTLARHLGRSQSSTQEIDGVRTLVGAYKAALTLPRDVLAVQEVARAEVAYATQLNRLARLERMAMPLNEAATFIDRTIDALGRTRAMDDWAEAHTQRGVTYALLADHEEPREHWERAAYSFNCALGQISAQRALAVWTEARAWLGLVMKRLGQSSRESSALAEGVSHLRAVCDAEVIDLSRTGLTLGELTLELAEAVNLLSVLRSEPGLHATAIGTLARVISSLEQKKDPDILLQAMLYDRLAEGLWQLGALREDQDLLFKAARAMERGIELLLQCGEEERAEVRINDLERLHDFRQQRVEQETVRDSRFEARTA